MSMFASLTEDDLVELFSGLTEYELVELLTKERILRMAATILHLEALYGASDTCNYVASRLARKAYAESRKEVGKEQ